MYQRGSAGEAIHLSESSVLTALSPSPPKAVKFQELGYLVMNITGGVDVCVCGGGVLFLWGKMDFGCLLENVY